MSAEDRYMPTYFDAEGERFDAVASAGKWTFIAYCELLRLRAWEGQGWRGSRRQLQDSIRSRFGQAPRHAELAEVEREQAQAGQAAMAALAPRLDL
jgi:hypothetical protein